MIGAAVTDFDVTGSKSEGAAVTTFRFGTGSRLWPAASSIVSAASGCRGGVVLPLFAEPAADSSVSRAAWLLFASGVVPVSGGVRVVSRG